MLASECNTAGTARRRFHRFASCTCCFRPRYNPFGQSESDSKVYLLILDSLGNTELLLILVAALIFFGPRRLPQLSRQLGKSLSEFRRASEDFKRTWEREVNAEIHEHGIDPASSFLDNASSRIRAAREAAARELNVFETEPQPGAPEIKPVDAELVEPRNATAESESAKTEQPKHEWI